MTTGRQRPHRDMGFESPIGRWDMLEAAPAPDLADAVECYWEGWGDLPPLTEKILPRTNIELMFNLRGRHRVLAMDGHEVEEQYLTGWLSGLQKSYLLIETVNGSHFLAARLKPWGAWRLLREPMHAVAGRVPQLDGLWGDGIHGFRDQLHDAADAFARFDLLEDFLRRRIDTRTAANAVVIGAVEQLHSHEGRSRIEDLCRELETSRATLARRFNEQVGLTPKTFARVVRVAAVMRRLAIEHANHPLDPWAMLAEDFGYHDQAHFTHEFQQFCGATPAEYLRRAAPGGGATLEDPPTAT